MVFETFLAKLVLGIRFGTALDGHFPGRLRGGIAGVLIGCVGQIHPGIEGGPRGSYHRNRKQQRRHAAVRCGQRALPDDSRARRSGARGHISPFGILTLVCALISAPCFELRSVGHARLRADWRSGGPEKAAGHNGGTSSPIESAASKTLTRSGVMRLILPPAPTVIL